MACCRGNTCPVVKVIWQGLINIVMCNAAIICFIVQRRLWSFGGGPDRWDLGCHRLGRVFVLPCYAHGGESVSANMFLPDFLDPTHRY